MEYFKGQKFGTIKNTAIYDSSGNKIGRLIDAVFKPKEDDTGLELTKFIVGGSRWEEFLEDIGIKPDIDPVFTVDHIKDVDDDGITLDLEQSELKSTITDSDAIDDDEYMLSFLSKLKVTDDRGSHVGRIIDLIFDQDAFQFIIGEGMFTELMEDLKLSYDVDFLLHPHSIESISEEIVLRDNKVQLENTFMKEFEAYDQRERVKMDADRQNQNAIAYFPTHKFS